MGDKELADNEKVLLESETSDESDARANEVQGPVEGAPEGDEHINRAQTTRRGPRLEVENAGLKSKSSKVGCPNWFSDGELGKRREPPCLG